MLVKRQVTSSQEEGRSATREALPQIIAVCVKNVLLLGFGMTLGFPTILIPSLSENHSQERITLGEESLSWIGSLNLICVPVGCLMSGAITQPLGRKRAMQMVNIPFLTAWLLFHFSDEAWHIFLALCITGITGGLLEAPVLTYVAEITQPHLRGILSSTSSMAVMLGILSQFLLGTFLSWRTVVLVNCSLPIISFILLMFVPETPVWLISKNRLDEARKSIAWLRGWVALNEIEDEFQEFLKQVMQIEKNSHNNSVLVEDLNKKQEKGNYFSKFYNTLKLFTKKNFYWPYCVVALSFFLGHFSGNSPLQIYAIKIFSVLKSPIDKYYATVLLGTVQLLGCMMCAILVNVIGKRVINFISLLGSGMCFIIVASYAYTIDVKYFDSLGHTTNITKLEATSEDPLEDYRWIPIAFLVISAFLSYIGIKILPWILTGEVYSAETRSVASGLSGGIGYIFGFISNKIFFTLVSYFTLPGVFLFYAFISLIGTICLYFVLPETEGKTLFEITEHFAGRSKLTNNVGRNKKRQLAGQSNAAFEPEASNEHTESRL